MKRKVSVTKICIICGKEFLSYAPNALQPGICSEQCRHANDKIIRDRFFAKHPEKKLEYAARDTRNELVHCRLCGGLIDIEPDRKKRPIMHDVCVYDDIIRSIRNHETLSCVQVARLHVRGYTVRSFRADYEDEINNAEELKT